MVSGEFVLKPRFEISLKTEGRAAVQRTLLGNMDYHKQRA